jgi:hypothetical protein
VAHLPGNPAAVLKARFKHRSLVTFAQTAEGRGGWAARHKGGEKKGMNRACTAPDGISFSIWRMVL